MFKVIEPQAVQAFLNRMFAVQIPIVYGQYLQDLPPFHIEPFIWAVQEIQDKETTVHQIVLKHFQNESLPVVLNFSCSTHSTSRQLNYWNLTINNIEKRFQQDALKVFDYTRTDFYPSHLFELSIHINGQTCFI
ncbi:MAG: hypothetical protein EAZ57_03085 [Cytophagales bacterium]|nr:MAG: hypothetical protein EAZ67_03550 [Cytophagales bacterium]TAF61742.1 MAG: hypothetical protein EAZ57_03085 [Cytophagales bacterium]